MIRTHVMRRLDCSNSVPPCRCSNQTIVTAGWTVEGHVSCYDRSDYERTASSSHHDSLAAMAKPVELLPTRRSAVRPAVVKLSW